jgi:hypothetical protein
MWSMTATGLSVDLSSMLDAKDRDFAALVVDRIEDSVVTLSDAIGFGLGVELFGLPRSGVGRQTQNEVVDSCGVVRRNVPKGLGSGFLDEDGVQLFFAEQPLPDDFIRDRFLGHVFLHVLHVLQIFKMCQQLSIVLHVEDDRFFVSLVVDEVRLFLRDHPPLLARQF